MLDDGRWYRIEKRFADDVDAFTATLKPSGLPHRVSASRAASRSGPTSGSSGPPASARGHSWEVRTAEPAPPRTSWTAERSTAAATAARQSTWSIGATVVGMASSRTAPVVTSSMRPAMPAWSIRLVVTG